MEPFVVARNPEPDSRLPYLVRLPLDGGMVLKVKDTWPRASRVYCYQIDEEWDPSLEVVDEASILICRRRGAAIDLVLDRPALARSQFIFTEARGRPAIFWQTQKAVRTANPGARVPKGRTVEDIAIVVDTREKYGYKFSGRSVELQRAALPAGDYGLMAPSGLVASVERKTLENLAASLSDGTLAFQMQRLAEIPRAAVVVEANYPDLFRLHSGRAAWMAAMLGRLTVRYPEIPVIFAGSRKFAEEWAYRFLSSAAEDGVGGP
ncbi:MAG TPA: ERCC4 domain-containing protein [Actinomycetota bacterium]|nr:ERCC4 domain-containing protein [Actinomycetota bacterium]